MLRITFDEAVSVLAGACARLGLAPARAADCARLFAEASLDGVYTHGLERFPRFASYIEKGWIDPSAEPARESSFGAWERWDGKLGPGNLNALAATDRAVELSRTSGLGCVALRNTNHWMRGGSYGLRAAEFGCALIAWTNTTPNLPAWGSRQAVLGNNPLVICIPYADRARESSPDPVGISSPTGHVLLDMAMSQFSYGKLEAYAARGEELPVEGGYDAEGRATRDPAAVLESRRPLPVGYWKGSGLSLVLDLAATILSGGDSVGTVGAREAEYGLSQVFIAFDLSRLPPGAVRESLDEMASRLRGAEPSEPGGRVAYPGQRTAATRAENREKGIPVREELWERILVLTGRTARR